MALKMKEDWEEMFGRETYQRLKKEFGEKLSDFIKYMSTPPEKRKENLDYELRAGSLAEGKDGKYYDAEEWTKIAGRKLSGLIPRKTSNVTTITFRDEDVETITVERPKPEKKGEGTISIVIGTLIGNISLSINKNKLPNTNNILEEINNAIDNHNLPRLVSDYIKQGIIIGARLDASFGKHTYDLTQEEEQKKLVDLLKSAPSPVLKKVEER